MALGRIADILPNLAVITSPLEITDMFLISRPGVVDPRIG
jgi:hypothetical protein